MKAQDRENHMKELREHVNSYRVALGHNVCCANCGFLMSRANIRRHVGSRTCENSRRSLGVEHVLNSIEENKKLWGSNLIIVGDKPL